MPGLLQRTLRCMCCISQGKMAQASLLVGDGRDTEDDVSEPELDIVLTTDFSGPHSALRAGQPCSGLHVMLCSTANALLCNRASLAWNQLRLSQTCGRPVGLFLACAMNVLGWG